jgi:hypothetical protein
MSVSARLGRFFGRWYFTVALALWVFSPEIRRIVDWQSSFHKLSLLSIVPLAGMVPALLLVRPRLRRLGPLYSTVALVWLGAFAYALFIGFFSGSRVSALYDAVIFVFPILAGIILATEPDDLASTYDRLAGGMLWLAGAASLYGVYQYVAPPPWDVYWVQNSGLVSTGEAVPFALRVFGTLNAYAPFAHFVSLAMVVNLPRLRLRRPLVVLLYAPCAIALVLTLDRTAWLSLAGGTVLYLIAAPARRNALAALGAAALCCVVVGAALLATVKGASDDVVSGVTQRFSTLGDVSDDSSLSDRQQQTADAYHEGLAEPLGQGLGTIGTATVASTSEVTNTLDNGYLARFVELGMPGFPAYLAALGLAMIGSVRAYRASLRVRDPVASSILAMCIAVQAMLLGVEASSDSHDSLPGLFFWATLYLSSSYLASLAVRRAATPVELHPVLRPVFGVER